MATSGGPSRYTARVTPRSHRIRLDTGLDYHVLEWDPGPEARHTVLLLHGFLDSSWGWVKVVEAGLGGYHVIAPDLRGHGDSDHIGAGGYYHFADYLADVEDLVRKVARERLSLVGHSMGGSVASYFTGTWPERVARLALLEGLGPPETGAAAPERIRAWLAAWRRVRDTPARALASVEDAAARIRKHDPRCSAEEALRLAQHGTTPMAGGVRFKHDPLHATPGPHGFQLEVARSFWRAVTCPVLLVDGAESVFMTGVGPDQMASRASYFTDSRREVLADAGHMMMRHQPAALAALLAAFLA